MCVIHDECSQYLLRTHNSIKHKPRSNNGKNKVLHGAKYRPWCKNRKGSDTIDKGKHMVQIFSLFFEIKVQIFLGVNHFIFLIITSYYHSSLQPSPRSHTISILSPQEQDARLRSHSKLLITCLSPTQLFGVCICQISSFCSILLLIDKHNTLHIDNRCQIWSFHLTLTLFFIKRRFKQHLQLAMAVIIKERKKNPIILLHLLDVAPLKPQTVLLLA